MRENADLGQTPGPVEACDSADGGVDSLLGDKEEEQASRLIVRLKLGSKAKLLQTIGIEDDSAMVDAEEDNQSAPIHFKGSSRIGSIDGITREEENSYPERHSNTNKAESTSMQHRKVRSEGDHSLPDIHSSQVSMPYGPDQQNGDNLKPSGETEPQFPALNQFLNREQHTLVLRGKPHITTILQDDLFAGHPQQGRLLGRLEGMLVTQWTQRTGVTLRESYQLCGLAAPDAILEAMDESAEKPAQELSILSVDGEASVEEHAGFYTEGFFTPPTGLDDIEMMQGVDGGTTKPCTRVCVLRKRGLLTADDGWIDVQEQIPGEQSQTDAGELPQTAAGEQNQTSPAPDSSPLSDCPSDLSEWDVADKVRWPACFL